MLTFTVFTPTYNRAHTLERVFQSLQNQTFRDFEWLIVDDGSTDSTRILVQSFEASAAFPIHYIFQENQGKHIAINCGVKAAKGQFFLTLDSDDACVPEALAVLKKHWEDIPITKRAKFCGVTARCQYQNGQPVGLKTLPNGGICDASSLELRYRYGIDYEMWGFICTDILRWYPFPEYLKNTTVPEGLVWTRIAESYKTRFVNDFLRLYFVEDNHESLINFSGSIQKRNFKGSIFYYRQVLNSHLIYFADAPLTISMACVHYIRFSFKEKIPFVEQIQTLKNTAGRLLYCLTLPFGLILFWRDKFK
jgi:glycosyltransferase involved in cell wall biosynthesis